MSRDPDVKRYTVDERQFAEMNQIAIQQRIKDQRETAVLHDKRPIRRPGGSYELYAGGRKIGNFESEADAMSELRRRNSS